jgi:hypothetical protein
MHVCMYERMNVCMYACMHLCLCACMLVCTYPCVCMYMCIHDDATNTCFTGKTFLLKKIANELKQSGKTVAVCAPTGVAALLVEGTTLHSLAGCGVPKKWHDFEKMWGKFSKKKWRKLEVLIVDEVCFVYVRVCMCMYK